MPELTLLKRIFPTHVAEMLVRNERVPPEEFANVTILFSDVVGFTALASECTPLETHAMLNDLYIIQDYCLKFFPRLYKVETIGDAFMVIGGAPLHRYNSVGDMLQFSLLINHMIKRVCFHPKNRAPIRLRIGIHVGDVVGGVVGFLMPRYTFAGDAVNFAARMQQICSEDSITMSQDATMAVASMFSSECPECKDILATSLDGIDKGVAFSFNNFTIESFGNVTVKGKGDCQTFALRGSGGWDTHTMKSVSVKQLTDGDLCLDNSIKKALSSETLEIGSDSAAKLNVTDSIYCPTVTNNTIRRVPSWTLLSCTTVDCEDVQEALSPKILSVISGGKLLPTSLGDCKHSESSISSKISDGHYHPFTFFDHDHHTDSDSMSSFEQVSSTPGYFCGSENVSLLDRLSIRFRVNSTEWLDYSSLNAMRVVVVEDSVVQSKLICRQVSSMNKTWEVKSMTCLDDVRKMFTESPSPFDMILIDMNLGTSSADGPSLLCSLRAEFPQAMKKIVVFFMSKDCLDRKLEASYLLSNGFWSKPLSPSDLLMANIMHSFTIKVEELLQPQV